MRRAIVLLLLPFSIALSAQSSRAIGNNAVVALPPCTPSAPPAGTPAARNSSSTADEGRAGAATSPSSAVVSSSPSRAKNVEGCTECGALASEEFPDAHAQGPAAASAPEPNQPAQTSASPPSPAAPAPQQRTSPASSPAASASPRGTPGLDAMPLRAGGFRPVTRVPVENHPFFDRRNIALQLINVIAQSVDAYSTQMFQQNHTGHELNPIARPFVTRGWGGQIVYSYGFGVGGTLLLSYLFHRHHHHQLERLVPELAGFPTLVTGTANFRLRKSH